MHPVGVAGGRDRVRRRGAMGRRTASGKGRAAERRSEPPSSCRDRSEPVEGHGGRADETLIAFLQDDHQDIQSEYEGFQTAGGDDRYFLANRLMRELELHHRIEEEVFYPVLQAQAERRADKQGAGLVRAALREHRAVKRHLARVKHSRAHDDALTAEIDALMERVRQHVRREEEELFPVARALLGDRELLRLRQALRERQGHVEERRAA